MLTNGSLQGVTILKDKILEDNTGVASHPDINNKNQQQCWFLFLYQYLTAKTTRRKERVESKASVSKTASG